MGTVRISQSIAEPQPNALVGGRYRVHERLGKGGMGVVLLAKDEQANRLVALKMIGEGGGKSELLRFKREFRAAKRLDHPGCVQAFELFESAYGWCYVMEHVRGGHLESTKRPVAEVIAIGMQVLAALDHIHSKGIVHRDIKPQNLLVSANGAIPTIKIADLGIARVGDLESAVKVGEVVGSKRYLSPEQALSLPVDPRCDLYALGVVLYELLTGKFPYAPSLGPAHDWVREHRESPLVPLRDREPSAPDDVAALVMRMLARDPGERPTTAADALDDLAGAARRLDVPLPNLPALERAAYLASPAFVGRDRELARLRRFLEHSIYGDAEAVHLLTIEGEAGMGKSRLASYVLPIAEELGATVSLGICRAEPSAAYEPVFGLVSGVAYLKKPRIREAAKAEAIEALGERATHMAAEATRVAAATRAANATAVTRLVSDDEPRGGADVSALAEAAALSGSGESYASILENAQASMPGYSSTSNASGGEDKPRGAELFAEQQQLKWKFHRTVADRFLQAVEVQPLVVMLDDAQWADVPTLELVGFLVRAIHHAIEGGKRPRVAIVMTHRPAPGFSALAELTELAASYEEHEHIDLAGLDTAATTRLMESMLAARGSDEFRALSERIVKENGGNPLYVAQALHSLLASDSLRRDHGAWTLGAGALEETHLPSSIADAIGDRAARFSVSTKLALTAAAVHGREFFADVLAEVAQLDDHELYDALDEATRAGFIEELGDRHRFSHDRFREAIYERLPDDDRTRLHLAVARSLEKMHRIAPVFAPDLAHHYFEGGDPRKAYRYGVRAGRDAMKRFAYANAAKLFGIAIQSAANLGQQPSGSLLESHGDACVQWARYDDASKSYRLRLDRLTTPVERGEILHKLGELEHRRGNSNEGTATLEDALREIGFPVPTTRAQVYVAILKQFFISLLGWFFPGRYVRDDHAPPDVARLLRLRIRVAARLTEAAVMSDFPRGVLYAFVGVCSADEVGPCPERTFAYGQHAAVLSLFGIYPLAFDYVERAATDNPMAKGWALCMRGLVENASGALQQSIEHQAEGDQLVSGGSENILTRELWLIRADGLNLGGRVEETMRIGNKLHALSEELGDSRGIGWSRYTHGCAMIMSGDTLGAITQLREASSRNEKAGDMLFALASQGRLAVALLLDGALDEALALAVSAEKRVISGKFRYPSMCVDAALMFAAAAVRKRDGRLDPEIVDLVLHTKLWGVPATHMMKCTYPLFVAGAGAWSHAAGAHAIGDAAIVRAVRFAEEHEIWGELFILHALAALTYAPKSEERRYHQARALAVQSEHIVATQQPLEPRPESG